MCKLSENLFRQLERIVSAPDCVLQHYRQDFFKFDFEYLERTIAPGVQYLWILRDNGTHLVRLGVHPRMNSELEAVFELNAFNRLQVYHICVGQDLSAPASAVIRRCTKRPVDLLSRYDYTVDDNGTVRGPGGVLASALISGPRWGDGGFHVDVAFTAHRPSNLQGLADLIALGQIAGCLATEISGSLFTKNGVITLDGADLYADIDQARSDLANRIASAPPFALVA